MTELTKRLAAALDMVKRCKCLADIGSDHAYLAIEAKRSNAADAAVAADIRVKPLERGKKNALAEGVEVDFVLSDGFEKLSGYKIDCAAICGMGAESIIKILESAKERLYGVRLILQPQSLQHLLRRYLWTNGFTVTNERFVIDENRPYTLIEAVLTGEREFFSPSDLYLGKKRPRCEAFTRYAEKILRYASDLKKGGDADACAIADECCLIIHEKSVILASSSPRRRELCETLHLNFTVCPAESELPLDRTLSPSDGVSRIAEGKTAEVAAKYPLETVIGADTMVFAPDGTPLGKPRDESDAFLMLKTLSGSTHKVITGFCIAANGVLHNGSAVSEVTFRALTDEEIKEYISTGEPMGKAGAYAIQGLASKFVKSFTGSYCNIIGFPREEIASVLLDVCK